MSLHFVDLSETQMFVPEGEELAKRLQNGLKQHFKKATVEWIECPDLTQEPFNLAAPGLCGDETLLEIGGMSQLFPRPRKMFNYYFSDILKEIYSSHTNTLVIGASIGMRPNQQLGELFVNASFYRPQVSADSFYLNNQSRLAFFNQATRKCALESITDKSDLACYPHGNFFISEGKPGKVLKVHAKNCIDFHFLTAMQCVLSQYSVDIPPSFVGLGGIFLMKKGIARTHVMPYSWDNQLKTAKNINNWLHYSDLNAPLVAVGTLISDSSYYEKSCQRSGRNGYGLTQSHFHTYSSNGTGGHFHTEIQLTKAVEYFGYFKPAKIFYHMDPHLRYDGLQDFTDIMVYW
ncbi:ester hydrolase C11orf54 homolog isoform X1 [Cataglyphis hispanica]|uniref:ester hydrolase C11orf54 homolog isoform X1 n=2 Tax=Cataglyphis hispanica TaxID=1086592 RepID=UPI00217F4789|nr:ester hydrolase C11orf54 homolog isoform X1 [Cataglyphis hispanica]XP_050447610.1 ester hydrolase C11orf54 homolog isoform X1 [Cataglyphis hispanica]